MQPEYSKEKPHRPEEPLHYPRGLHPPAGGPDDSDQGASPAPARPPRAASVPIHLPDTRPTFTYILLGVIVLIYLIGQALPFDPQIVKGYRVTSAEEWLFVQGAKINEFIIGDGEYYRLLTAMFLHGGLAHLFFNAYALYIVGRDLERLFGHGRFLLLYFLSGLTGSVLSLLISPYASVGASGAIFGLFGAQAVFFYRHRRLFGTFARQRLTSLLYLFVLNAVIGLLPGSRIDNAGHLGGLLGGLALSWLIGPLFVPAPPTPEHPIVELKDTNPVRRWWFVPLLYAGGLVLAVTLVATTPG